MASEQMALRLKRDVEGVDWQALSDLYRATLGPDEPAQLQRTWSRSYATVLAYDNDRLIGAARAISDGEREALVVGVAVLPDFQGKRVGTAMMRALLADLEGVAVILMCEDDENVSFYQRLGFRTLKRAMALRYSEEAYAKGA